MRRSGSLLRQHSHTSFAIVRRGQSIRLGLENRDDALQDIGIVVNDKDIGFIIHACPPSIAGCGSPAGDFSFLVPSEFSQWVGSAFA